MFFYISTNSCYYRNLNVIVNLMLVIAPQTAKKMPTYSIQPHRFHQDNPEFHRSADVAAGSERRVRTAARSGQPLCNAHNRARPRRLRSPGRRRKPVWRGPAAAGSIHILKLFTCEYIKSNNG